MMKKGFLFIAIVLISVSCRKRLDNFLFSNDNSITEYLLDDYTGRTTLDVGDEYHVADSMIHKFMIPMNFEGEEINIAAIYVGDTSQISLDTVIMYCHGTADHMDFYWSRQKLYANLGSKHRFGVLMIDYPGYGLSEGKPTEANMYASVNASLKWLKNKGLTKDRLVLFGFSLGTAPTCEVAGNTSDYALAPGKFILEAPFASSEVLVQDAALLAMPASYFVNVKVDNAEEIKKATAPFLWIHGEADSYLSIHTHGEVVFAAYPLGSKTAVRVPGGDHENTPFVMGYSNYLQAILSFIEG
jgi:pimeloyl-ACP methyl ester carboxylesterase